jgi:hypothetical protein
MWWTIIVVVVLPRQFPAMGWTFFSRHGLDFPTSSK